MQEFIQFKKQRDLGAILTDTFKFIRLNFKPLFGLIFRLAGPALVVMVLSFVYYNQTVLGGMTGNWVEEGPGFSMVGMIVAIGLLLISAIAFYALLYSTILYYIKSYIAHKGEVDKNEVIEGVKKSFWNLIALSFLVGLMTGIGMVFCFIPGIYLGTVLVTTYAIHIFDKKDVTDSISYSFNLIKGEWWITFATLLVMFIIYYIVVIIGQIPQYIYFFVKGFTVAEQLSLSGTNMIDWGYLVLSSFGMVVQYLMQSLIVITTCFIYFNLNEKKNFSGTLETIETLGEREDGDA